MAAFDRRRSARGPGRPLLGVVAPCVVALAAGPVAGQPVGLPLPAPVSAPMASPDRACRVSAMSGLAPEAEQVRAVRRSCAAAQERFSDLFGERAPAARVVLWAEPGYRTAVDGDAAVVFWPLAAGDEDPARLPHEIAHVLLAARYGAAGGEADGEGGYGTPLPDWLEEGVAIWAEPAVQREARVAHARRLEARFLDLGEIVTGSHPAAADPRLLRIRDGAAPPADDALWAFYPQSIAVLTFVYEHGGAAAVRAAAERFTDHGTRSRGLAGLPGLPATESGVVRAWEDWLRRGD